MNETENRGAEPLCPRGRRRWVSLCPAAVALGLLLAPPPAAAELVVLSDGGWMKVDAYEVVGEKAQLTLPSGGRLALPLTRVERVVDDEIVREPEPAVAEFGDEVEGMLPIFWEDDAPPPATPFADLIHATAERHGLHPELVAAVVRAESAFDVGALSPKGARGLMQLMPATALRFGVAEDEIFEPERNLDAGTRYLAWLLERFEGELPLALAAYNAGEGTVDRYGGVPPFRETRTYLRRIYSTLGLPVASLSL